MNIRPICKEHIKRYGEIYAAAFSGEPWNDPWDPEDAAIHVSEIMEQCIADMKESGIAGLNLITEAEGFLPEFYEKYGFKRESHVILMGRELL